MGLYGNNIFIENTNKQLSDSNEFKCIKNGDISTLKLKIDNKIIGKIDFYHKYNQIANFEIKKQYRGNGYGSILFDEALKRFNPKYLSVAKDNKLAYDMYIKRGFKVVELVKDKTDHKDYYFMERY